MIADERAELKYTLTFNTLWFNVLLLKLTDKHVSLVGMEALRSQNIKRHRYFYLFTCERVRKIWHKRLEIDKCMFFSVLNNDMQTKFISKSYCVAI